MNLSSVSGNLSLRTSYAFCMRQVVGLTTWWSSWIEGKPCSSSKDTEAHEGDLIGRYRQISTFGNGTIRTFSANSSEMKKLAARDFEDLLQVCVL